MNKIFKVVWNKARNCYVVGSELISNHSRGKVRVDSRGGTSAPLKFTSWAKAVRVALAVAAVCGMSFVGMDSAYAASKDVKELEAKHDNDITIINKGIGYDADYGTDTVYVNKEYSVRKNIGLLDGAITTHVNNLNTGITTINNAIGNWTDWTKESQVATEYIDTKNSIRWNISRLDTVIQTHVTDLNNSINIINSGIGGWDDIKSTNYIVKQGDTAVTGSSVRASLSNLDAAIGPRTSGKYINENNSVTANLKALDEAITKSGSWKLQTSGDAVDVAPGDTVTFAGADSNISVTNEGQTVKVGLSKELTGLTKVETKNAYVTNVAGDSDTSVTNVKYVQEQLNKSAAAAKTEVKAGANVKVDASEGNNGQTVYTISATDTKYTAGKGIEINTKNKVSVKLKDGEKNLKVNNDGLYLNDKLNVTSVTAGGTVLNSKGLSFSGGSFTSKGLKFGDTVYVSSKGLNAGSQKITNVLAGTADTDAVNVSQLNSAIKKAIEGLTPAADTDTHVEAGTYTVDSKTSSVTLPIVDKDGKETDKNVVISDVASNTNLGKVNDELVKTNEHFNTELGKTNEAVNAVNAKADANTAEIARVNDELVKTNDHFNTELGKTNAAVNANTEEIARVNGELVKTNEYFNNEISKTNDHFNAEFQKTNAAVNAVNAKADANTKAIGTTEDGTYVKHDNTIGQNLNALDGQVATNTQNIVNLDERVTNNSENIANNSNRITRLGERVNKVGAGAAALAALHPMDFDPDDKLSFAAGVGNYNGSNAAALGMFYRPDEKVMFSVGGTMGNGENMVNAGVSFALDRTNHVSNSRTAMAREIVDLRGQLAEMGAKMAKMEAMFGMLDTSKTALFPDIPENHWAYEYVAKLAGNGIIEGYPDGSFGGDRHLTRYEFAAALYRALEKGQALEARILKEFAPELGRIRVERINGADNDKNKIERVRVNRGAGYGERDHYGSQLK